MSDSQSRSASLTWPTNIVSLLGMNSNTEWLDNLTDRDKAREALPHVAAKIQELKAQAADLEELYGYLSKRAGLAPAEGVTRSGSTGDRALKFLNERPAEEFGVSDVALALGPEFKEDTVRWALYDLYKRGMIRRPNAGRFAALGEATIKATSTASGSKR